MEQNMLKCLRCETEMVLFKHEKIQLGEQSFWHNWNHLIHGALDVDIYVCPQCGKIEMYMPQNLQYNAQKEEPDAEPDEIIAKKCTACGRVFSAYASVCPQCGETEESFIPQIRCKCCGAMLDFDAPKCPACGYVREEPPTLLNSI